MLDSIKKELTIVAKKAQADGLCKHKTGNFSMRDRLSGNIAITPTSLDREIMSDRDIVVLSPEGEILENLSGLLPTSEALMHLKIYETKTDVVAIAHTHSPYATTFAILNMAIPAITYEVASMGMTKARIPVAPYGRPGTKDLANSIVDAAKESEAFLLEKHGSVALSQENIYEAYLKASFIEELAQLYHHTLSLSHLKDVSPFTQEELNAWRYPKELATKKE